jgi:hypothetical protein
MYVQAKAAEEEGGDIPFLQLSFCPPGVPPLPVPSELYRHEVLNGETPRKDQETNHPPRNTPSNAPKTGQGTGREDPFLGLVLGLVGGNILTNLLGPNRGMRQPLDGSEFSSPGKKGTCDKLCWWNAWQKERYHRLAVKYYTSPNRTSTVPTLLSIVCLCRNLLNHLSR